MKSTLLALSGMLAASSLVAQITVTQSDMPSAGDSIRVSYATGLGNIDQTLTGPNYFWDYSTLQPAAQQMMRYGAPSALPFNFLATVDFVNPSPDSLPFIGSVPSNFTDYFKNGSSGFRQIGLSFEYTPLGNFSVPVIFSSNDYVFRFPENYNNLDSSFSAYNFNIPNLAYVGHSQERVNQADGWGTLVTPYGTFNTLRVRSVVNAVDTFALDTLGTGISTPRPTEIQYKWMANGMKIPVLEVDAQMVLNNEVVTNVIYQDSLRDSVLQVGIHEPMSTLTYAAVFPNPSNDNCFVSYHMAAPAPVALVLTDLAGREVMKVNEGMAAAGDHLQPVHVAGISPGVYFLNIISGNSKMTRQVVVTH